MSEVEIIGNWTKDLKNSIHYDRMRGLLVVTIPFQAVKARAFIKPIESSWYHRHPDDQYWTVSPDDGAAILEMAEQFNIPVSKEAAVHLGLDVEMVTCPTCGQGKVPA